MRAVQGKRWQSQLSFAMGVHQIPQIRLINLTQNAISMRVLSHY
jgi:hypothetical protein